MRPLNAKPMAQKQYRICANCKQHLDKHKRGSDNRRMYFCDPKSASPLYYPAYRQMDVLELIERMYEPTNS